MLLPSEKLQRRLDTYGTINEEEAAATHHEWRRLQKRRNHFTRLFAGLALLGVGLSAYTNDVRANEAIQASAEISIDVKAGAMNEIHNDTAIVFIDGFNSYDADTLTEYMSMAVQPVYDGQLWSVDYNNAPLESQAITDRIIETARERGVHYLAFVGYSAGGDVAMEVQEQVRKQSNLTIEVIFLVSTPNGVSSLRPARQNEINLVENLTWIPGIEHSTPIRFLGELAFRSGAYTKSDNPFVNAQHFFETSGQIQSGMKHNQLPGAWLMIDQMFAIQKADLEKRIKNMGEIAASEVRPTLVYLGTAEPGYDYMVDNEKTDRELAQFSADALIQYYSYDVPGAVHSRIDIANKEYILTLGEAGNVITTAISVETSRAQLHRVTSQTIPPLLPID